jgi:hypothetical protein
MRPESKPVTQAAVPSRRPAAAPDVTSPASAPVMSAVISEARALQLGHLDAMLRGFDHRFGHLGAHDAAREPGRWSLGIDDRAHA